MAFLFLLTTIVAIVNKIDGSSSRHSEYASRIQKLSNQKFLPKSLWNLDPKPIGDDTELECQIRTLALQYANQIQPFRSQDATSDALNIEHYCQTKSKTNTNHEEYNNMYRSNKPILNADSQYTVYVDPINGNDGNKGDINSPFQSIYAGLNLLRSYKNNDASKQIILRKGTIYMNTTIYLSPTTFDNNLLIRAYPNENVTISGGILLNVKELDWKRYNDGNASHNIWMTTIDTKNMGNLYNNTIFSLFTLSPHRRLTRARFPNGHVEALNGIGSYYINPYYVTQWYLPPNGSQYEPNQVWKDLSNCTATPQLCLNKSGDHGFDTYTAGYGKLCDHWTPSYSYWCGNNTAGGWADQDRRMATEGIRQLPIGMLYNTSVLPEIAQFGENAMKTAIFYIHHSQGWNSFWWEIGDKIDLKTGNISLGRGGNQGGRVWTKTTDLNHNAVTNLPIMAGSFYIDNVFTALDMENEWFFDKDNSILYYWPNNTKPGESPIETGIDLVIGNLAHLFFGTGDSMNNPLFNVTFEDILFRDTRYTYLEKEWSAPSGGDWALYRYGAFYFENSTNCSILSSSFHRLDGNVISLYGYNRNISIIRNDFGYIGDNIIGTWGITKDYDGTDGLQPRFTYISENYVHDIGLYQLQSSLFFQGKSCQNSLYNNIVYNIPRAAILINDAFGGGTEIINNLIFNTCMQSGDHGPLNSWNRMPFLTKVADGITPSFDNKYNLIKQNFIFANYGGSQAFDTDDGSAWHIIDGNFFYDAMAYKNDYGGYNVQYINNINIALNGGTANSWGIGPVNKAGPGNTIYGNKIIVFQCPNRNKNNPTAPCDTNGQLWSQGNLDTNGTVLKLYNNDYYTPNGNASILTTQNGKYVHLDDMCKEYNVCCNSTANLVPSVTQIITWGKQILNMT